MPNSRPLDLSSFDGRLLDGLRFSRIVYDFFDQARSGPDGNGNLLLRKSVEEKRLVEELIPIARYVQARYREGYRIKVRWFKGTQPYDAVLLLSGTLVERHEIPRELLLEVTTSVHKNEYLVRERLHRHGGSFGVKGTSRDKKTGDIISVPRSYSGDELVRKLTEQIVERLRSKSNKRKPYPRETVLVINCVADTIVEPSEWNDTIQRVIEARIDFPFREVFMIEPVLWHTATLYRH